jgi:DMSO/TMAO reductase YedYZ molybdopterin-dependent catalytic subunit
MKPIFISLFSVSLLLLFNCKEEGKIVRYNNENDGTVDVTTMATPNGGKLNPAEQGPVRSALGEPEIDLNTFRLEVTGLVDSSFSLSWEAINRLPSTFSDTILMYCVEGWEVWGNWKGIPVKELLDKASRQENGKYVLFHCAEGYTTTLPVAYLEKYNSLLAYEVNGNPLKPSDGFPLRLTAFGKYGYKWAKWVEKLEVIDESRLGYWEGYGYSDQAEVPVKRRRYYEGPDAKPLDY